MSALRRVFSNGHSKPALLPDEVETAVKEVLREAEELCRALRKRRQRQEDLRDDLA